MSILMEAEIDRVLVLNKAFRYRNVPTFGRGTIQCFTNNVSAMKKQKGIKCQIGPDMAPIWPDSVQIRHVDCQVDPDQALVWPDRVQIRHIDCQVDPDQAYRLPGQARSNSVLAIRSYCLAILYNTLYLHCHPTTRSGSL